MSNVQAVPERHQGRRRDERIPQLNPKLGPSLHSATSPKSGLSGITDKLGLHQLFTIILQDYIEDEEIRKTHREPAEPGSEEDKLQQLRDKWLAEYDDMLRPPPPGLPPWRVVNHRIPLIDENKQYRYRLSRCPEAVREELLAKIKKYYKKLDNSDVYILAHCKVLNPLFYIALIMCLHSATSVLQARIY